MDPDANLQEQERLEHTLRSLRAYGPSKPEYVAAWERRSDLRLALGAWLRNGGFEPDWSKAPVSAKYYRKGKR